MLEECKDQFQEVLFLTPTLLEKAGGFWPLRLGRNVAKANYQHGPKVVNHYCLHFVLGGSGTFIQNERIYPLRQGDLFCLFPKISQIYYTDKEDVLRLAWFSFIGKQAPIILNRIGLRPYTPHLSGLINDKTVRQLDYLFEYLKQPWAENYDIMRQSALFQLFYTLPASLPEFHVDELENSEPWMSKGLEYMKLHYTEGITVTDAAEYAGVERTHFSKLFQRKFGMSPKGYLESLIMKEAGRMVKETNYTFSEIALSVGYPDLYAFSRAFKRHYGISPTQSRESR